ncbi:MAG: hypothetical protein N3J91_00955 [Verrucomicrobiae bacterium]|nr:hypothetical protein [Verrucomicrobiae bacterium]
MNLTDDQKAVVRQWIDEGLKLSDIQKRLASELGVHLTYMEVRLLISDLQVMPKDAEPPAPPPATMPPPAQPSPTAEEAAEEDTDEAEDASPAPPGTGQVSVSLDTVAMPGAALSGKVTFSDGQKAQWYLDQYGRLGIAPTNKGYRPSPGDIQAFQMRLQQELEKMGF